MGFQDLFLKFCKNLKLYNTFICIKLVNTTLTFPGSTRNATFLPDLFNNQCNTKEARGKKADECCTNNN